MGQKISDYTSTASISDADLLDVSVDAGGGTFTTRSITGETLKQAAYIELITIDYTDIQTAALTNNITAYSLPAGYEIKDVWRRVTTAFAGSGITALTNELGISGNSNKYGFSQNCLSVGYTGSSNRDIESDSVATNIVCGFTAVGANLDQLTQGELKIYATIKKVF